jgi:hypothetical protein
MKKLRDISEKYRAELNEEGETEIDRLNEMHDFYDFVTENFPESIEAYKKSCRCDGKH